MWDVPAIQNQQITIKALTYIPTEGAKSLWPFANCSMDLITDLPLADGYDSILVVVDQGLSKGVGCSTGAGQPAVKQLRV